MGNGSVINIFRYVSDSQVHTVCTAVYRRIICILQGNVCGRTDGGDGQPCGGARPCPSPEYPSAGIPLMHIYVVPVVVTCTVLGCAVGVMWGRNHNRVWCGGRWAQDGTLRDRHQRRRRQNGARVTSTQPRSNATLGLRPASGAQYSVSGI